MAWVQIQKAQEASWDDYERVSQAAGVDENPPEDLILHAAGEETAVGAPSPSGSRRLHTRGSATSESCPR